MTSPTVRLIPRKLLRSGMAHEVTVHAAFLERYAQSEVAALLRFFDLDMIPRVKAELFRRLGDRPTVKSEQYERALRDMRRIIDEMTGTASGDLRTKMLDLAGREADYVAQLLERFDRSAAENLQLPPSNVLRSIVAEPVFDRKLGDWFEDIGAETKRRVERSVTRGIVLGNTTPQIITDVVGPSFVGSRKSAETLVRTAVTQVSNRVRSETFEAAGFDEYEWVATLEARNPPRGTCVVCAALDGQVYKVGEGPMPTAHPNCRCTTVPVTRFGKIGTRASEDGPTDAETMDDWLERKDDAYVDAFLGKGKADVWRRGVVPLEDFIRKRTLEPLTLRELEALEKRRS